MDSSISDGRAGFIKATPKQGKAHSALAASMNRRQGDNSSDVDDDGDDSKLTLPSHDDLMQSMCNFVNDYVRNTPFISIYEPSKNTTSLQDEPMGENRHDA